MNKLSQLVEQSTFFQVWNGKKQTIKNWYGVVGNKVETSLYVTNQNKNLQALKETGKDSPLTINEIKQLHQHEPRLLTSLVQKGITYQYQTLVIDMVGKITKSDFRINLVITNTKTNTVFPVKVTHAQALKELTHEAIHNDVIETLSRLYKVFKD